MRVRVLIWLHKELMVSTRSFVHSFFLDCSLSYRSSPWGVQRGVSTLSFSRWRRTDSSPCCGREAWWTCPSESSRPPAARAAASGSPGAPASTTCRREGAKVTSEQMLIRWHFRGRTESDMWLASQQLRVRQTHIKTQCKTFEVLSATRRRVVYLSCFCWITSSLFLRKFFRF